MHRLEEKHMIAMDLEDFLSTRGVGFSTSGYCLDKLRSNRQLRSERGRRRFEKECEEAETEYQLMREEAKREYNALCEAGKIRPLTTIERTVRAANGHPDNASTQAARRMCEKRGIDWTASRQEIAIEEVSA